MHRSQLRSLTTLLLVLVVLLTAVPPIQAAVITYVSFRFDPNFGGGAIVADRCINANYHWLTSEEIAPSPKRLGSWSYGAINGCVGHYPALGVLIGDVIDIGIGSSDTPPGADLFNAVGTQIYRVTRTSSGLTWEHIRTITPPLPPNQPPTPPALLSPPNGATLTNRQVTLTWQDPGDPDNGPRGSRDYVAEIWQPSSGWRAELGWQFETSWTLNLPSDGSYAWHVRSGDGALASDWSATASFTVQVPTVEPPLTDILRQVEFRWDANYGGGSIVAYRCVNAAYHWLTSEEIAPAPKRLGSWRYGYLGGCAAHYPALGVLVGDVIEIGIGASNSPPGNDLFSAPGTRFYRVTRTAQGLHWEFVREVTGTPAEPQPIPDPQPIPGLNSVSFSWKPNYGGGSIVVDLCVDAAGYWLTSEELSPQPKRLGSWKWGTTRRCVTHYPALGVLVGDVLEIGIGAGANPGADLFSAPGTRFYRITRTAEGLSVAVVREIPASAAVSPRLDYAEVDLNLPYVDQVFVQGEPYSRYWVMCGAASTTMVLSYYHAETRDVLNQRQPTLDVWPRVKVPNANLAYSGNIINLLREKQLRVSDRDNSPTFEEIRANLSELNPVIISMKPPYPDHILVVTGIRPDGSIVVNDSMGGANWWTGDWRNSARNDIRDERFVQNPSTPLTKGNEVAYRLSDGPDSANAPVLELSYAIYLQGTAGQRLSSAALVSAGAAATLVGEGARLEFPTLATALAEATTVEVIHKPLDHPGQGFAHPAVRALQVLPVDPNNGNPVALTRSYELRIDLAAATFQDWGVGQGQTPGGTTTAPTVRPDERQRYVPVLRWWDTAAQEWVKLPSRYDQATEQVVATTQRYGEFAIFIEPSYTIYLPLTRR